MRKNSFLDSLAATQTDISYEQRLITHIRQATDASQFCQAGKLAEQLGTYYVRAIQYQAAIQAYKNALFYYHQACMIEHEPQPIEMLNMRLRWACINLETAQEMYNATQAEQRTTINLTPKRDP